MESIQSNTPYPRLILGLDVSTTCIGMSLVMDDGVNERPMLLKMTYVTPKPPKEIKTIESLFIKRDQFEETFAREYSGYKITDVVIEEPLISSNNANTVAALIGFNRLIADSIYRNIKVVPSFISSYDARMFSFPELVALRKYNKKGVEYPLKHVLTDLRQKKGVLFGAYPFDIDKKSVMMSMVNKTYPQIHWIEGRNGDLRKENFDMCDSLICALAYVNINHHGIEPVRILSSNVSKGEDGSTIIDYVTGIWGNTFEKKLVCKD